MHQKYAQRFECDHFLLRWNVHVCCLYVRVFSDVSPERNNKGKSPLRRDYSHDCIYGSIILYSTHLKNVLLFVCCLG